MDTQPQCSTTKMHVLEEAGFWQLILMTLFCRCRSKVDPETKQKDLVVMVVYYKWRGLEYKIGKYILKEKTDISYGLRYDNRLKLIIAAVVIVGIVFVIAVRNNYI